MQRSILAVSPDLQLLEQIRSHLEEGGRFRVHLVKSAADALSIARIAFFDVAILDAEIADLPFVPFTRDLIAFQPELKLLVFPIQNNPHHPVLTGLVANGFLNKPFFTPEVGSALAGLFDESASEPISMVEQPDDPGSLWVQHPEIGMQRIEQLLRATTATTGLLIMKGQVIAGCGHANDQMVNQILALLTRYWGNDDKSELVRFLKDQDSDIEHLIYAAPLINNVVIALIYPPISSIQKVRAEVTLLRQEFQKTYPTTSELRKSILSPESAPSELPPEIVQPDRPVKPFSTPDSELIMTDLKPLEDEIDPDEIDNVLSVAELKNLDNLLANMPPPDPDFQFEEPVDIPLAGQEINPPISDSEESVLSEETLETHEEINEEAISSENLWTQEIPVESTPADDLSSENQSDFDFRLPWEAIPIDQPPPLPNILPQDDLLPLEEEELITHENLKPLIDEEFVSNQNSDVIEKELNTQEFESTPSFDLSQSSIIQNREPGTKPLGLKGFRFNYTCILIPKNPRQFLARDLSDRLGFILPQLHLGYGWRLTGISIRPQYLLWSVSVSLDVCPIQIIREIRRRTSTHIFSNFPELRENELMNDFWSSGFLVISGTEPPSINLVYDFISLTRQNQA
jgi:REP element-mobilizing transposase RayT/CheY-like chemotaxis protein